MPDSDPQPMNDRLATAKAANQRVSEPEDTPQSVIAPSISFVTDEDLKTSRRDGGGTNSVTSTKIGATSPDADAPSPSQIDWTMSFRQHGTTQQSIPAKHFGDYELLQEIARGGMGVVYKARQLKLNRIVAVKMILGGNLASPEDVMRFSIEAKAAAQLDHPGIVPIFEVSEFENQHYYSMGFVEGQSLAKRLADGPLEPRAAAEMVKAVSEAVQYAHEKGVVHRDLKPANILLDEGGRPRVTDFGLAKLTESGSDLTGTGQILGTPSYMPPEQAKAQPSVGRLSDVYSLGAILYCLLTGRPPFQGVTPLDTIQQLLSNEPVPPTRLVPKVPRDLETICLKCLRKEPHRRYDSAAALAEDLQRWLEHKPIRAKRVTHRELVWLWCRRNPVLAGLNAGLCTLLFTVGVILYVSDARDLDKLVSTMEVARPDMTIDGSSTVFPILRALAADFRSKNRDTRFSVDSTGSKIAFAEFALGTVDIVAASRPISEREKADCRENRVDWVEIEIATDAILVMVNPENDWCNNMTVHQLRRLFRPESRVEKWSELDPKWPDEKIAICGCAPGEDTFEYFTEVICGKKGVQRTRMFESASSKELCKYIHSNKYAIGYVASYYKQDGADLTPLSISPTEGADVTPAEPVTPSPESVRAGRYRPLSRPLFVYFSHSCLLNPKGVRFARFCVENAPSVARKLGFVETPQSRYAEMKNRLAAYIETAERKRSKADGLVGPVSPTTLPLVSESVRTGDLTPTGNLIRLINLKKHVVQGNWQIEDTILESSKGYGFRIEIPVVPSDAYEMIVDAEPLDDPNGLILGQRMAGRRFQVVVNFLAPQPSSVIESIDGKGVYQDNPTIKRGQVLRKGERSRIVCTVHTGRISVTCDGQPLVDWEGDPKRLSVVNDYWQTPHKEFIYIGAYDCRYRIHEIRLIPVDDQNGVAPEISVQKSDDSSAQDE